MFSLIEQAYGCYKFEGYDGSYNLYMDPNGDDLLVATDYAPIPGQKYSVKIPNMGKIFTSISAEIAALAKVWGFRTAYKCSNAFYSEQDYLLDDLKKIKDNEYLESEELSGRVTIGERLEMLPLNFIVGYHLVGLAWDLYFNGKRKISNLRLPKDLKETAKIKDLLFIITTKDGDVVTPKKAAEIIDHSGIVKGDGHTAIMIIRDMCQKFYKKLYRTAYDRWVIIANAKFEMGVNSKGRICFSSKIMTPESAMFWDSITFQCGEQPKLFGGEAVSHYASVLGGGSGKIIIPKSAIEESSKGYINLYERLFHRHWQI